MEELKLPIEVQLVMRDMKHLDTRELLIQLQDIVDEWYWKNVTTTPCVLLTRS